MTFRADPFDNAFPIIHQCLPEVYIKVWEELRIQLRMSTTLVIQRYYDEKRRFTTNGRDGHSVR
jgi:hypothetical protein